MYPTTSPQKKPVITVKINRFDTMPWSGVVSHVVGFTLSEETTNAKTSIDSFLPRSDGDENVSVVEIVKKAFRHIRDSVEKFENDCNAVISKTVDEKMRKQFERDLECGTMVGKIFVLEGGDIKPMENHKKEEGDDASSHDFYSMTDHFMFM